MKLKLQRTQFGPNSTLGRLLADDIFECFTLEDTDRKLEDNPDAKVYGETCIPRGTYQVIITFSQRFKKPLPLLVGVKGFEGIRIHPGNKHADTHGCLLPGTSFVTLPDGNFIVNNSREAFRRLYAKIEAELDGGGHVEIEVV